MYATAPRPRPIELGPFSPEKGWCEDGGFVALVYELGRARATGVLEVQGSSVTTIELAVRDGSAVSVADDVLSRRVAERLRAAARASGPMTFRPGSILEAPRSLPLVRWAREHVERGLDHARAELMTRDLAGARVALSRARALDPTHLDDTDRALVAGLSLPRSLSELALFARVPRFRLLGFVRFLAAVGALAIVPSGARHAEDPRGRDETPSSRVAAVEPSVAHASAFRLLGIDPHADGRVVRSAFKKLVRALHPDLQPGIGEARRRELERRLAHVNAAYLELTGG